jgi:hypothetical protein
MARLASLLFLALTLVASAAAGPALRNGPPVVVDLSKVFKTRPANWRLGGPDNEAGPLAGLGIQCNIAYRGGSVMLGTVNTYLIFYGESHSFAIKPIGWTASGPLACRGHGIHLLINPTDCMRRHLHSSEKHLEKQTHR